MQEIIRTNNIVVLSFVEAVLRDQGVECLIADENMSVLDGSVGIIPRRVIVHEDDLPGVLGLLADPDIYPHLNDATRKLVDNRS